LRNRISVSLLVAAALPGSSLACNSSTLAQITAPAEAGGPADDGSVSPFPAGTTSDASSPIDDGSSSPDATSAPTDAGASSLPGSGDGGPDGAVATSTGGAAVSPGWAMWPMPNAPTSGLPHPQSYDTSVAGIALDRVTGLTWQRDAKVLSTAQWSDATPMLEAASAYCASLGLAGYEDWRVPSRIELVSIMNFRTDPAENASVFGAAVAFYLSSSVEGQGNGNVVGEIWVGDGTISSAGGSIDYAGIAPLPPQDAGQLQGPSAVRCVRGWGSASGPHYTVSGGEVHDHWTGLTWIQSLSAQSMLPSTVSSYCTAQTLDGGGWRAPSVNELETLFGDGTGGAMLDPTAFPAAMGYKVGTSDTYVSANVGGPVEWMYVVDALTGFQQDENYLFPIPGGAPASDYWVYAQCVR
jgi:hypothetical protein